MDQTERKKPEFFYFVDDVKYETNQSTLTGAVIKEKVPNFNPQYILVLEGQGNHPDQVINDDTTIDLTKDKGPKRFFTAPPATFGLT